MENLFKKRLKELRKEKQLTQKQVAKVLNKSETGYASWEQGLSEPNINDLIAICKFFDVTLDYLVGVSEI